MEPKAVHCTKFIGQVYEIDSSVYVYVCVCVYTYLQLQSKMDHVYTVRLKYKTTQNLVLIIIRVSVFKQKQNAGLERKKVRKWYNCPHNLLQSQGSN